MDEYEDESEDEDDNDGGGGVRAGLRVAQSTQQMEGRRWRGKGLGVTKGPARSFTSFVVLAVSTQGLHGHVAAGAPPARLADAVPPAGLQGAASVVVAETRAALCRTNTQRGSLETSGVGGGAAGQQGPVQASTNRCFFGTCGDDSFFFLFAPEPMFKLIGCTSYIPKMQHIQPFAFTF